MTPPPSPNDQIRFSGPLDGPASLGELPSWIRDRFARPGLDPHRVVSEHTYFSIVADSWEASSGGLEPPSPALPSDHPHARINYLVAVGDRWLPPNATGIERRRAAFVAAHEAGHMVHLAAGGMSGWLGERGTVNELVADELARLATGITMDRQSTAPLYGAVPGEMPRHVRDFVHTKLDEWGTHINASIPNAAADAMHARLTDEEVRAVYLAAAAEPAKNISTFARSTQGAAEALYGRNSSQASAVRDAWDGVGITAGMRARGAHLHTRVERLLMASERFTASAGGRLSMLGSGVAATISGAVLLSST